MVLNNTSEIVKLRFVNQMSSWGGLGWWFPMCGCNTVFKIIGPSHAVESSRYSTACGGCTCTTRLTLLSVREDIRRSRFVRSTTGYFVVVTGTFFATQSPPTSQNL